MATIHNTVVNAGGVPLRNIEVVVSLSADSGVVATVPDQDRLIRTSHTVTTDHLGYWEATVFANDEIDPVGTFYKVVEADQTYFVDVVSGATPEFWVGDILAATPAWEV